jgi:hypothetical protein
VAIKVAIWHFPVQTCSSLDKPGLNSRLRGIFTPPELAEKLGFFVPWGTLGRVAPRLLSPWCIHPFKEQKDEAVTRHHVQENAREKNPAASHDLQALRRTNLFAEFFESSPRGARQKNSLRRS